jgi:acyl-CoA reductase-like NAD-dependent aldehyde dehydrogenase
LAGRPTPTPPSPPRRPPARLDGDTPGERIALVEKLLEVYKPAPRTWPRPSALEMGAPIDMARTQQVGAGSYHLKNFIRAAKAFEFERPLGDHAPNDRIIYEAVGVAALITPWNWPMNQITLKVGAAAVAGCTMVLKPSEQSPLERDDLCRMHARGRLPAGRVQPGQRRWCRASARNCRAPGCGHGQLHRLDPGGHR